MIADPYPYYHALQRDDPVHWNERLQIWVLTRYAEVAPAMRDERISYHEKMKPFLSKLPEALRLDLDEFERHVSTWLGHTDPPHHTRLRGLIHRAFVPRLMERMRLHIQTRVEGLINAVEAEGRGEMDVIWDFAYPLPASVIAEMLGVPAEDHQLFKHWTDDIVAFMGTARAQPDDAQRALNGVRGLSEYVRGVIAEHRQHPRETLISGLMSTDENGGQLSEDEIVGVCSGLFIAGHETTTNLIGNGMLALLRNRDQLEKLRDNPILIGGAVEELLRYDSPVQRSWGVALDDMEIGGKRIRAGELVLKMLGAANRDPEQFPDPDTLDIERGDNRHIAFGYGFHFCLGAPLARIEGQIAINTLLRRLPNIRLAAPDVEWHPNIAFRGLKSLPVTF
ncbi:MAG: cytochrome P450 [Burkholderiales bacterium]|nr:cytochrome P450 [Anaerolineae bacterium]